MRKFLTIFAAITVAAACFAGEVHLITIEGSINPVTAQFLIDAVDRAERENAEALIIKLDTPGGLMASTRSMVKRMLPAKVPLIVYVAPSGARAGSAGVFITLAGHIAAMAPGTNIGAAHPVNMGGGMDSTMNKKVTNDAVAFIRSIAEQRGKEPDWAEAAVRESVSITDRDALEKGVADVVARDIDELLSQLNGRKIQLPDQEVTLSFETYELIETEMTWREKILNKLSDPNIAYILLMLGFYGLLFELYNPGAVLPGIIGGICLILAFFALQTLPVNYAGLLLILFSIILFVLEIKVTSYGMLTIGGIVSLILGSIMLYKGVTVPAIKVSYNVLIPVVVLTVLFFLVVIGFGIRAQRRSPDYGKEALLGKEALALEMLNPEGLVRVEGEMWMAIADGKVKKGEKLVVKRVQGMRLYVGKPTDSSDSV